ncbi:MAG TPA: hypothetical protein PLJ34_04730 [Hyphomicrobiales bacterium]|nr:hypothetical protein [Kaistiaceae bacterium]HQF30733.1 hypothetical protein [Hyphomicrobiales bacterium]
MRSAIAAVLVLCAVSGPGLADECRDRFASLLAKGNPDDVAVKTHITQKVGGAPETRNYNYWDGTGDWMSEMIEPDNIPWSMARGDTLYMSTDKGKSWSKVRTLDAEQNKEDVDARRAEEAKTVRNTTCGEEEIDGVRYRVVEGDYTSMLPITYEHHNKYWLEPDTGWIARVSYETIGQGIEFSVLQVVERAPDLVLPKPE